MLFNALGFFQIENSR